MVDKDIGIIFQIYTNKWGYNKFTTLNWYLLKNL